MKNKKLLYILIPSALFVWGMILYKIFLGTGGNESRTIQKIEVTEVQLNKVFNDTFTIDPRYRDPFSGKQIKKVIVPSAKKELVKKVIEPVVVTQWPQITYGGIVKNQSSNKQLILIQVNGESTMLKIGERFNNIELTKVYKDSIEVKFGKERKCIKG